MTAESEYLYGVKYHGRGPFIIWYESRSEAVAEAEAVEDKHAPAELVRVPISAVQNSGIFFNKIGTR